MRENNNSLLFSLIQVLYPNHRVRCLNLWDNVFLGKNDYSSPTNLVASYSSSSSLTSSSASSNNTNNVTPRSNNENVNHHNDHNNHGSNLNNGHFIDPFSGLSITSTNNIIQSNGIHQGNGTHDNGIVQSNGIHRNGDNVAPPLPSTDSDQKMNGHLSNGFHHSNTNINGYSENGCEGSSRRHATKPASNHNGATVATDSVVMNDAIECSEHTENNIVSSSIDSNPMIDINEHSSSTDTVAKPITSISNTNINGACVEDNLSRDSDVTERDECSLVSTKKNNEEDDKTLVDGETTVSRNGVALPVDTYGQLSSAASNGCGCGDSTMTDSCRTLASSEHNIHNASSGGSNEHRTSLDDLCLASGCTGVSGILFTI